MSLRLSVAQGLELAGVLLLPLMAFLTLVGPRFGLPVPQEFGLPGFARFFLFAWGLPAAATLLFAGYLCRPTRPVRLGSRLSPLLGLLLAGFLWVLGMACLLFVLMVLIGYLLGIIPFPSGVRLAANVQLQILLMYLPVITTGVLALFAARKWFYESRPPTLFE
jgi:hypothetical protein